MQSNQIIIINGTLREIGAFLLLSRRAHLLTTHKMGGGTAKAGVRSPRVAVSFLNRSIKRIGGVINGYISL